MLFILLKLNIRTRQATRYHFQINCITIQKLCELLKRIHLEIILRNTKQNVIIFHFVWHNISMILHLLSLEDKTYHFKVVPSDSLSLKRRFHYKVVGIIFHFEERQIDEFNRIKFTIFNFVIRFTSSLVEVTIWNDVFCLRLCQKMCFHFIIFNCNCIIFNCRLFQVQIISSKEMKHTNSVGFLFIIFTHEVNIYNLLCNE